ncbi:hypothetical protein JCM10207_001871 [Rhodosporidiobolus poonsookiae]
MQPWRGGPPPSFPSHSSSSDPTSTPSTSTPTNGFGSFTSLSTSSTSGRGRGRGRGSPRGGAGAGRGAASRSHNLSWRNDGGASETIAEATEPSSEDSDHGAAAAAKSAFAAFGDPSAFGAFGSGGASAAFGAPSTSAFGSSSTPAFGGGSAFGASGSTSAFPPATSAFPSSSTSAFSSSTPAFGFGATSETPLFRPSSTDTEEEQDEQADEPEEEEQAQPVKRAAGQISTLEVLGEDSDARKKRFEATLPNNRYLELKPLREEERLAAIKAGLIPDPSKPMRLDQATDFQGTCEEMCPEWEREEREYQNNVDPLERYPGTSRIDPSRAVKAFHRPAAGNDAPLPGDVRPPAVLHSTLDYLFHTLLPTQPLAVTHPFLRDRTRSIRQDFTVQNVRGKSAIEAHERIARYHILALGALREQSGFSESQELEQLRKVLKSLNEFYDDARISHPAAVFPNEPEFRAYNLLTHLRDPDIIWSIELLPSHVFSHPLLQTALALHRLAQKSNLARGERASPNAFSRFFKLVADPSVPYLFGCILSTHFSDVRRNALDALRRAFIKQHCAFPLATLAKTLGCDDEDEARSVCEQLGVVVRMEESGRRVAELHREVVIKAATLKQRVSKRLVEAKRGSTSYPDVIDGKTSAPAAVSALRPSAAAAPPFKPAAASSAALPTLAAPKSRPPLLGSSPIATPVPTPPPGSSPFGASAPSLSANATPFVPTFGLPKPAVPTSAPAPPPATTAPPLSFPPTAAFPTTTGSAGFSFAPAQPTAAAPPPPPPSVPSFSFAPAPAQRPPPAAAAPPPAFFTAPATQPLAPSSLRAPVTAAPFVPAAPSLAPLSTAPSLAKPPLLSPRVVPARSPTVQTTTIPTRRVSVPLPSPAAAVSSHIAAAAAARRAALVASLASALTAEIVGDAVVGPVRRAGVDALKARWAALRAEEERERAEVVSAVARRARDDAERLSVRETVVRAARAERERRRVLREWVERTKRSVVRREEEAERERQWREVVKGIGGARKERRVREAEDAEEDEEMSDDDELEVEEEEEEGVAGMMDLGAELDFGGLSLAGLDGGKKAERYEEVDLAEQLRQAAELRSRIWKRGSFLALLASSVSTVLSPHYLAFRPAFSTLISTTDPDGLLASWLSCKFDLDGARTANMDTPYADVEVRMLEGDDQPEESELNSTGLLVVDCTAPRDAAFDWNAARARLATLIEQTNARSLFSLALLVVLCPDRSLSNAEQASLREKVSAELDLPSLRAVAASSVYIVELDGAEAAFSAQTEKLLRTFTIRRDRVPRPLSAYLDPLLEAWRTSMTSTYRSLREPRAAATLVSAYLAQLRSLIGEAEAAMRSSPAEKLIVPPFSTEGSLAAAVAAYIAHPSFTASAGNFPDVAVSLAQRPPLTDLPLARLLLEHLALFVSTSLTSPSSSSPARATTTQGALDASLPAALERLESALDAAAEEVSREQREEEERREKEKENRVTGLAVLNGTGGKLKRRASKAPEGEEYSSPKKPSLSFPAGASPFAPSPTPITPPRFGLTPPTSAQARRSATPSPSPARFGDVDGEEGGTEEMDGLTRLEGLLKDARRLLEGAR